MNQNYKNYKLQRSFSRIDYTKPLNGQLSLRVRTQQQIDFTTLEPWKCSMYAQKNKQSKQHKIKNESQFLKGYNKRDYFSNNEPRKRSNKSNKLAYKRNSNWVELPSIQKINIVMPIPVRSKITSKCYFKMFKNQFIERNRRLNTEFYDKIASLEPRIRESKIESNHSQVPRRKSLSLHRRNNVY